MQQLSISSRWQKSPHQTHWRMAFATLLGAAALYASSAMAAPSEYKVLHNFGAGITSNSSAGMGPLSPPRLGRDGKLYGLISTYYNRHKDNNGYPSALFTDPLTGDTLADMGCIFYRVDAATGAYEKLAEFETTYIRTETGPSYNPSGDRSSFCLTPVQASNGDWIGSTIAGGKNKTGTIWRYKSGGNVETLFNFPPYRGPNTEGIGPKMPLIKGADDTFYGATSVGGANGNGTLFKFRIDSGLTVVHAFAPWLRGQASPGDNWQLSPSSEAAKSLILSRDGKRLLGSAQESWSRRTSNDDEFLNQSSLYEVTIGSGVFRQLSAYPSGDIYNFAPTSIVQLPDSDDIVGVSDRTENRFDKSQFFRFSASTGETEFQSQTLPFTDPGGGAFPQGLFVAPDGKIYGTLMQGSSNNAGSIFRLNADGSHEVIYMLAPGSAGVWPDSRTPNGGFLSMGPDGLLYGVTATGTGNLGAVFRILPGDKIAPGVAISLQGSGLSTQVPNFPDPYTIVLGQSATLRWGSVEAQNCRSGADWPHPGPIEASGEITIQPTTTGHFIYTVNCENAAVEGEVFSASLAVQVLPKDTPPIVVGNGGGGGAIPLWMLLPLALLAAMGRFSRPFFSLSPLRAQSTAQSARSIS